MSESETVQRRHASPELGFGDVNRNRVAVVVVNWNAGNHLSRCIDGLGAQTLEPSRIILVDNGSTDGSLAGLDRATNREIVRLDRNTGFARACNVGIELANDVEWVALLNPDAFPRSDWLERLVGRAKTESSYSFFASRQIDAANAALVDGAGDVYSVSGLAWRRFHGEPSTRVPIDRAQEVFGPCAAAALYRREALEAVGGFDESFFCYFEDVDLAFRLRLRGERCLYVPDAIVDHVGSATTARRSDFAVYHGHRNLVWCWFKNMPASLMARYWPWHLLLHLASPAWLVPRGQGGALFRATRDALAGLARVMRARRHIQAQRRVSTRALRSQMAHGMDALSRLRAR